MYTAAIYIYIFFVFKKKKKKSNKTKKMSATMDSKLFRSFFHDAPIIQIPGRTYPVTNYYLEDLLDVTNHMIEEGSRYAYRQQQQQQQQQRNSNEMHLISTIRGQTKHKERIDVVNDGLGGTINNKNNNNTNVDFVSNEYPTYKMTTRLSMDRVNEEIINYDLIEDVLEYLLLFDQRTTTKQREQQDDDSIRTLVGPDGMNLFGKGKSSNNNDDNDDDNNDGSILIFLPGLGEIRTLSERLESNRNFSSSSSSYYTKCPLEIIPLHSSLSSQDQKRAFVRRQLRKKEGSITPRKVILSTNIAETSVTIPDVVCGKKNEMFFVW